MPVFPVPHRWAYKPPPGTAIDPDHPRARGLRLFWLASEGAGSIIRDAGPYRDNGTFGGVGTILWAPGDRGPALNFSTGTGEAVGNTLTVLAPSVTMAGRAMQSIVVSNGSAGGARLCSFGNQADHPATFDKELGLDPNGKLRFFVYDGSGKTTAAGSVVPASGAWFSFAGTADGVTASAYLNGALAGTVAAGATFTGYSAGSADIWWGGSSDTTAAADFYGDHLAVWDRALTAAEVADHHADPYALILPPATRRYFAFPAAADPFPAGYYRAANTLIRM